MCTNEVFMWPSIVFQPASLARSLVGAAVWRPARPLQPQERADYSLAAEPLSRPIQKRAAAAAAQLEASFQAEADETPQTPA